MTAAHIVDPAGVLTEVLGDASPDLMRHLLLSTPTENRAIFAV